MVVNDGEEDINREEVDEKRIIPIDPLDEKCFKKIKSWVFECEGHSACSIPRTVVLPKRIIEIPSDPAITPRVCLSDGKTGEYIVLSHCFGDVKSPAITNFPQTLDTQALPKTLADAIAITRHLGYKYLWAGPLCIIQGDKNDWNKESSNLASTYGQAVLMLSATVGEDSNSGILHGRHIQYSPALGVNKNRYLRLRLLRWKWDIECSSLARRAWASIERILAPRIVHFTQRQMIWECAAGVQFEASGIIDKKHGSGQVRQFYRKQYMQPYIEKALFDHPIEVEAVGSEAEMAREVARFEAWHNCLDEFSGRQLSASSDKLPAITPIARIIDDGNMGEYLAGVWSKNVAFGLAWGRSWPLLKPSPTYRAPSWSWASVDGPISSTLTSWPETMMQDHAKDRTWLDIYEPKLISHHMKLADPAFPYSGVLEGSHITISGTCIGLMKLANSLKDEQAFRLNFGLDQSPVFDCTCCMPQPGEERKAASEKFNNEAEHHICMILMGDAWRIGDEYSSQRGICDLVVLRACEGQDTYQRVGFARVQKEFFGSGKRTIEETHRIWDGLEKRKSLRHFPFAAQPGVIRSTRWSVSVGSLQISLRSRPRSAPDLCCGRIIRPKAS